MTEAEAREEWLKKQEGEENLSEKDKREKEAKLKKMEQELRQEMEAEMGEWETKIRTVAKKKVALLIKKGNAEDSDQVKEEWEKMEKSIKVSQRKIRARYERKIRKLGTK